MLQTQEVCICNIVKYEKLQGVWIFFNTVYTHVDENDDIPLKTSNTQTETLKRILWSLCRSMVKVRLFAKNALRYFCSHFSLVSCTSGKPYIISWPQREVKYANSLCKSHAKPFCGLNTCDSIWNIGKWKRAGRYKKKEKEMDFFFLFIYLGFLS